MAEEATEGGSGSHAGAPAVVTSAGDRASGKPDEGLVGWFRSFKYMAALTGVLASIWALFPSFYLQGYLSKLGVPVSSFPVETIDASVTLHRVMISVLMNFAIFVPDHPAFLVIGGLGAVVL